MSRAATSIFATIASFAMLIGAIATPFILFISFGRAPCADEGWLYFISQAAVPITLLIGAIWLGRLKWRPNARAAVTITVVILVVLLQCWGARRLNAERQRQCETQTLEEAASTCRINWAIYRKGNDRDGKQTLTLLAPGTTDKAWNCLSRWADHNGTASLKIDDSVYRYARQSHSQ